VDDKKLAVIIPTFSHFEYAGRAIGSALSKTSHSPRVIVVDDGSPDWNHPYLASLNPHIAGLQAGHPELVTVVHFTANGGLTRCWNHGLRVARTLNCDYAAVTNSDVIFTPGWDAPLVAAVEERGFSLVGPVTNAPGTEKAQDVRQHYLWPLTLTDDGQYLAEVAERLRIDHGSDVVGGPINGFCMMARTDVWWANAHDGDNVFRPRNDFNSRGEPNPTPLMTLQEYELQRRWHGRGLKTGFCPGSFVWHYRSVTRGDRYRSAGSFRPGEK
jgi:GT2 family glycosyltransferase